MKIIHLGDQAIQIIFGHTPDLETSNRIRSFCSVLVQEQLVGVEEWVPAYLSVTIFYNPSRTTFEKLHQELLFVLNKKMSDSTSVNRIVTIPVCYDEQFGIDLDEVASHNHITKEEVITLHSERKYLVYMIGFTPGFPYLGGLNEKIATPRKITPRARVVAGSVGIAGSQTGIYPLTSPGGWQIIGRTPLKLFDSEKEEPVLLRAGDYLQFEPISLQEYRRMEEAVMQGDYQLKVSGGEHSENTS